MHVVRGGHTLPQLPQLAPSVLRLTQLGGGNRAAGQAGAAALQPGSTWVPLQQVPGLMQGSTGTQEPLTRSPVVPGPHAQVGPEKPGGQRHLDGAMHTPPFRHPGLGQTAAHRGQEWGCACAPVPERRTAREA
jgi:hypothetical protein